MICCQLKLLDYYFEPFRENLEKFVSFSITKRHLFLPVNIANALSKTSGGQNNDNVYLTTTMEHFIAALGADLHVIHITIEFLSRPTLSKHVKCIHCKNTRARTHTHEQTSTSLTSANLIIIVIVVGTICYYYNLEEFADIDTADWLRDRQCYGCG